MSLLEKNWNTSERNLVANTKTGWTISKRSMTGSKNRLSSLAKADNNMVQAHAECFKAIGEDFPQMKQILTDINFTDEIDKKPPQIVSPHIIEQYANDLNQMQASLNMKKKELWRVFEV